MTLPSCPRTRVLFLVHTPFQPNGTLLRTGLWTHRQRRQRSGGKVVCVHRPLVRRCPCTRGATADPSLCSELHPLPAPQPLIHTPHFTHTCCSCSRLSRILHMALPPGEFLYSAFPCPPLGSLAPNQQTAAQMAAQNTTASHDPAPRQVFVGFGGDSISPAQSGLWKKEKVWQSGPRFTQPGEKTQKVASPGQLEPVYSRLPFRSASTFLECTLSLPNNSPFPNLTPSSQFSFCHPRLKIRKNSQLVSVYFFPLSIITDVAQVN